MIRRQTVRWPKWQQTSTPSLTHSLIHSSTHPLTHSLALSLAHSLTHSSINHSLTHSLTHSLSHSLTHSLTHSLNQSINQSIGKAEIPWACERAKLAPAIPQSKQCAQTGCPVLTEDSSGVSRPYNRQAGGKPALTHLATNEKLDVKIRDAGTCHPTGGPSHQAHQGHEIARLASSRHSLGNQQSVGEMLAVPARHLPSHGRRLPFVATCAHGCPLALPSPHPPRGTHVAIMDPLDVRTSDADASLSEGCGLVPASP